MQVYIKQKIYIPEGNRCCQNYLIKNRLYHDDINRIKVFSNSAFISGDYFKDIINCFVNEYNLTLFYTVGENRLSEDQIYTYIYGFNLGKYKQIESYDDINERKF